MLKLRSNASVVVSKVLKLSSEVSVCKPLHGGNKYSINIKNVTNGVTNGVKNGIQKVKTNVKKGKKNGDVVEELG